MPYQSVLQDDLSVFNQLRRCRQQAHEIAAQFPRVKALVAASSALPTADAEQLTQKHASLERQLSRHMDELLQLQAQALARLSI